MERYSDTAIEIINDLHTERMDYQSEYLPLIDAANQLAAYESTGIEPERVAEIVSIIGNDYDLGRLRDLVEADRAGRCVVLPFDIGDSVFDDGLGKINEWEVTGFSIGECHFDSNVCGDLYDGKLVVHTKGKSLVGVKLDFPESAIGSYVFTDHDATEAALEKMREAQA